jgi:chaperonin GroEL
MQYQKVQSAAKRVASRSRGLEDQVQDTLGTIAEVVGGTLGPGGRPVLIERYEHDLPPVVTKDGVTVFKSLGFEDPVAQCVMEAARDAAVRTAGEAGDGTTTATVLADALVRHTAAYCRRRPKESPQRVVRQIEECFRSRLEPILRGLAVRADLASPEGRALLRGVARVSANGDDDLAGAVMECFDVCGDDGNVTLQEARGSSRYEVERVEGFPVASGFEESCRQFYPEFLNERETQRCVMEAPVFVLYHGRLADVPTAEAVVRKVADAWTQERGPRSVVVVATEFGEQVQAMFAANFRHPRTVRPFPLVAPGGLAQNAQRAFLDDLAAFVDAEVYDPLTKPLDQADLEGMGAEVVGEREVPDDQSGEVRLAPVYRARVRSFEASRFRSSVIGFANEDAVVLRVDELRAALPQAASRYDEESLRERMAKLSCGIARLRIFGPSNGETKEKRDRAEDAVCAVRGALKHGCLYGGGWALLRACRALGPCSGPVEDVLKPALLEPVRRLLENAGFTDTEQVLDPVLKALESDRPVVFDAMHGRHVDPREAGLMDSLPAVLEAVRSSISIATLLGTLGGAVVYARDRELERREASDTSRFMRSVAGQAEEG